jgi:general stress protein 26
MGVPDKAKILDIMRQTNLHAHLATCDGDQPQVRPVSPIVEDDMSIWVATRAGSRKVKQIRGNSKVSLAFVELPRGRKAATVIGRAVIIDDPAEKKRIWHAADYDLSVHFPDGPKSSDFALLKIEVDKIEWRDRWEGGLKTFVPAEG